MTELDLDRIERELGVRLPEDYRAYCLGIDIFPEDEDGERWEGFFALPGSVIGMTQEPIPESDYDKANWKSSYVTIGETGSGDVYLIDTALPISPVYVLSHEDHSIEEEYPSLSEALAEMERELEAWKADERRRQEEALAYRKRLKRVACCLWVFILVGIVLLIVIGRQHRDRLRRQEFRNGNSSLRAYVLAAR